MTWKLNGNTWTFENPDFYISISAVLLNNNLYRIEYHKRYKSLLAKDTGVDIVCLIASSPEECKERLLQLFKKARIVSPALEDALTQLTPLTPWKKLGSSDIWQVKEDPFILTLSTTHSGSCLSLIVRRPSSSWTYTFNGHCPKQLSFDLREQMVILGQNLPRTILVALDKLPIV